MFGRAAAYRVSKYSWNFSGPLQGYGILRLESRVES